MKKSILILIAGSALALAGCKGGGKTAAGVNPACTGPAVDFTKLEGTTWVKSVVHNDGRKELDPGYRIRFTKAPDGRTMGEYIVGVDLFEMYGTATADKLDMEEQVDPADVKIVKEQNKDPSVALQSTLYLRPKARGCRIEAMDRYKTYVDGKEIEQRSPVGQYDLAPFPDGSKLSFARCTGIQEIAFADKSQTAKGPGGLQAAVVGQPVKLKSTVAASKLDSGCTDLSADLYVNGKLAKANETGSVEGKKATWYASHTFAMPEKAGVEGYFVEVYRYAQCGGERKLHSVACNAIPVTVAN